MDHFENRTEIETRQYTNFCLKFPKDVPENIIHPTFRKIFILRHSDLSQ